MTLATCLAFSLAVRISAVSSPSCLLALVNCLPAFPTCLVRALPPPVPGTFTPRTRFGLRASLVPSTTPPTRPATVPAPARTVVAPFDAAFPFEEDRDAPPLLERAVALDPFRLRAGARPLVVPRRELLALLFEALAFDRGPLALPFAALDFDRGPLALPFAALDFDRGPLAFPFEALDLFLAFEPPDDARDDWADDDLC